jgi:hypothetical protein
MFISRRRHADIVEDLDRRLYFAEAQRAQAQRELEELRREVEHWRNLVAQALSPEKLRIPDVKWRGAEAPFKIVDEVVAS